MTTADSRDLSQFTYTTPMKFDRFFYSGQPDDFNLTTPAGSVFCHCLNVIIITFSCDLSLSHGRDLWYGMVNVDLYSAIITKVSNALDTLVSGEKPGFSDPV